MKKTQKKTNKQKKQKAKETKSKRKDIQIKLLTRCTVSQEGKQ